MPGTMARMAVRSGLAGTMTGMPIHDLSSMTVSVTVLDFSNSIWTWGLRAPKALVYKVVATSLLRPESGN